jgi:hypothetical protein
MFHNTILLVSMRIGDTVLYAKCGEMSVEALVLSTPVALDGEDFLVEKTFDMCLELNEDPMNIRFVLNGIDPREVSKVINEANIVATATRWTDGRAANICVNKF